MKFVVPFFALFLFVIHPVSAVDTYDRADAWEYHKLLSVTASSSYTDAGKYFDPNDMFGAFLSTQEPNGHYAFGDALGSTTIITNYVDFETIRLVPLTGYKSALGSDLAAIRKSSQISLFGFNRDTQAWQLLHQYMPLYDSVNNPNHPGGTVSETNCTLNVPMFVGRKFRFEVVNHVDNLGPRVIEFDALVAPNLDEPALNVTSPNENVVYDAPAEIPITYSATDSHGIDSVEIRGNGGVLYVGAATGSYTWTNSSAGSHRIEVKAIDKIGGETIVERNIRIVDPERGNLPLNNPRMTATDIMFDVTGFTVGNTVDIYWSTDLKTWDLLDSRPTSDDPLVFSDVRNSSNKFYKAQER